MNKEKQEKINSLSIIYVMPYSHTDYAWTNTREWHICRYIEGIEQILKLMNSNNEITWIIDNVIHGLIPVIENRSEILQQIKKRVSQGRIYVANGGVSLARPTQVGAETYIRNLVLGKKILKQLLETDYDLDFLFNADTACGHSQLPQIMKLSGHKYYRFFRPEGLLNSKNIPKQFIWTGLDGSSVIVSRGSYNGFSSAEYLSLDFNNDWDKVKEEFYDEELRKRLTLHPTGHLMLNHGSDDCFPLHNVFDKPIELIEFMKVWNEKEKPRMVFSTPKEYFSALEKENLPIFNGVLDHNELSYNIPLKGEKSIWRKRYEIDTLITRLEKLSSIAAIYGIKYEEENIKQLWLSLFEITGHAIEAILKMDYEEIYSGTLNTYYSAKQLIKEKFKELAFKVCLGSGNEYIIVNTEGFDMEQVVRLHITSPHGVRNFELYDIEGNKLDFQFADTYTGDKNYISYRYNAADVLVNIKVAAMSFNIVKVKELEGCLLELKETNYLDTAPIDSYDKSKSLIIDTGKFKVQFGNAYLLNFSNFQKNNIEIKPIYNLRFVSTKPTCDWQGGFEKISEDYFVPTCQRLIYNGPIQWKYEVNGFIGSDKAKQTYVINELDGTIDIDVEIQSEGREGFFTADFNCDVNSPILADIPFGYEKREFESGESNNISTGSADIVELGYKGQFYGHSLAAFEYENSQYALLSRNCSIYYNYDNSGRVSLVLYRNLDFTKRSDKRNDVWVKQCPEELLGKGTHHFSFSLMTGETKKNFICDAIKKCREKRNPLLSMHSFYKIEREVIINKVFSCSLDTFIVTACYFENGSLIVRGYESLGEKSYAKFSIPINAKAVFKTDLLLNIIEKQVIEHDKFFELEIKPFEIVTLKIDF